MNSSEEKRQQLARLLRKKAGQPKDHPPSYAQERLWFLDQLRPGDTSYNLVSTLHIAGTIDVPVLRKSLNEVVRRHDILRTVYPAVDGQVVQRVLPEVRIDTPVIDLSHLSGDEAEVEVRRQTRVQADLSFNLADGPLIRVTILHLSDDDRVLLAAHHISVDAWSFDILLRELSTLYNAFLMKRSSPLPDLKLQYADWARWEREVVVSPKMDRELAYWRNLLAGLPPVLALPYDRERPPAPTQRGGNHSIRLPKSLRDNLVALGQAEGATPFMALLAGCAALIYRWSASADLAIGTPMTNRTRDELESLIGLFINTVVLRVQLQPEDTFRSLLRRARDVTIAAFAHQDLPFEKLVEAIHPSRSLSHNPVFQVMLVVQSSSQRDGAASQANIPIITSVKFDLSFNVMDFGNGLDVLIAWSLDLFDVGTITRLGTIWENLLTAACAAPDRRIDELQLVDDTENHLQTYWSGEETLRTISGTSVERLIRQALKSPEAPAVLAGERSVSYRELLNLSRRIADALKVRIGGLEPRVGLAMESSPEMVAAIFGIWMAGGAVVPLPPDMSRDHLTHVVSDVRLAVIVSKQRFAHNLVGIASERVLIEELLTDNNIDQISAPQNDLAALACVLYPLRSDYAHGFALDHGALIQLGLGMAKELEIKPEDRVGLLTTSDWSGALDLILATLLTGATVVCAQESIIENFLRVVQHARITVLRVHATVWPRLANRLARVIDTFPLAVRLIVVTGEPPDIFDVGETYSRWCSAGFNSPLLVTYYRSGEAAFPYMFLKYPPKSGGRWRPIGRPREGFTARVRDGVGNPVPAGFLGDLYIGGPAIEREIWGQPKLTAARLSPDPFSGHLGARCLAIAKRARCGMDGVFEIVASTPSIRQLVTGEPSLELADSGLESRIASIWSEVLAVEKIGVHDNFFDLGGHSLAATRVIARVRKSFSVEIPLRVLFEYPTIGDLATYIRRLETRPDSGPGTRAEEGDLPLSFAQERLWFLHQLLPSTAMYNIPVVRRWDKKIDPSMLEHALNEVVTRHETLRTIFPDKEGRPIQRVLPHLKISINVVDLRHLPSEMAKIEAGRLSEKEGVTPFDLSVGPLLRAQLVLIGENESILLLTVHHIVADGWSFNILFSELEIIYEASLQGHPSPLTPVTLRYTDWAVWQRKEMSGKKLEQLLRYWRTMLQDAPPLLQIPTDRPRSRDKASQGGTQGFRVASGLRPRLEAFSQNEHCTLFMTLLAGLYALLYRWSGQSDIVVGSPIANRTQSDLETLIGFFANTLALRARIEPADTFRTLARRVREMTLEAYGHQDLPFEKLVEELQPTRNLTYNPLFQVLFVYQDKGNSPRVDNDCLGDHTVFFAPPPGGTSKFDLSIFVIDHREELVLGIEYSSNLFDADTIIRLGRRYSNLLAEAMSNPDTPIDSLRLISAMEEEAWHACSQGTPAGQPYSLADAIMEQAYRTPDSIGVIDDDTTVTYAELATRAKAIASKIMDKAGPGKRIGLCAKRSAEAIVASIAVILIGGAYVPLEPAYPLDLLRSMVADAQLSLIIVDSSFPPEGFSGVPLLELEWLDDSMSTSLRWPDIQPEAIAYIIYTSGSTGRAKGVMMTHRGLANLIDWQIQRSNLPTGARTLQFASRSFDVSVQETFATLCAGGTLVVANDESRRNPQLLLQVIHQQKIARLFLPPVMLRQLAVIASEPLPKTVREIIVAGEQLALSPALVDLLDSCPQITLYNQYGPTETHVVTEHRVTARDPILPPIGRPLPGTTCYVLDASLQLTGPDCSGELYVGGLSVAHGYLNSASLTADKFVPNPFDRGRLYRTGDRARMRSDGSLEFIGRSDDQIKVRGFRIEPGEIETVIECHPGVQAAAVSTIGEHDRRRLAAFVIVRSGTSPTARELRNFVRARLPQHMVPESYTALPSLPMTSSGKLDRRALLQLAVTCDSQPAYLEPRSPAEKSLATIWAGVLGCGRIGAHDNFFDLGGHSLLATQVIARARTAFNVEIPLSMIFDHPTLEELALAVVEEQARHYTEGTARLLTEIENLSEAEVHRKLTKE